MPAANLKGERFNRLTVIERKENSKTGLARWLCRCECGKFVIVSTHDLRSGNTKSCGCYKTDFHKKRLTTHGESNTRLYRIWKDMKRRTSNPKRQNYAWYGWRGIRVCDEWTASYKSFKKWAMENGYNDSLSIDRIDADGDYCPENCRWATMKEQAGNRHTSVSFTYKGNTKLVAEWAELTGIPYTTLIRRVRDGWEDEKIFKGAKVTIWAT